jgi:hypothetical protein
MSHITKIGLKIRDLDAVAEAAERCGMDLRRNQTTHIWYGRTYGNSQTDGTCEHALRLKDHRKGDYEIGLVRAADGDGFELALDSFMQSRLLDAIGGSDGDKLKREYAAAVATKRAKAKLATKGFTVRREDIGNRIRLHLVRR